MISIGKTLLKKMARITVYFLTLVFALFFFIFFTTPGLYSVFLVANKVIPGHLTVKQIHGRLFDDFRLKSINYTNSEISVDIASLDFKWQFSDLFKKQLHVALLSLSDVTIKSVAKATEVSTTRAPKNSGSNKFSLPFNFTVDNLSLSNLALEKGGSDKLSTNQKIKIEQITSHFEIIDNRADISQLKIKLYDHDIAIIANTHIKESFPLTMSAVINSPNQLKGKISLSGSTENYQVDIQMQKPEIQLQANLKQLSNFSTQATWHDVQWPIQSSSPRFISNEGQFESHGSLSSYRFSLRSQLYSKIPMALAIDGQGNESQLHLSSTLALLSGKIDSMFNYNLEKNIYDSEVIVNNLNLNVLHIPIKKLDITTKLVGKKTQTTSVKSRFKAQYYHSTLSGTLIKNDNSVTARVALGDNLLKVTGFLPYRWQVDGIVNNLSQLSPLLQGIKSSITLKGQMFNAQNANMAMTISPGSYAVPSLAFEPLTFQGGQIKAVYKNSLLNSHGKLAIDKGKQVQLDLSMPNFKLGNIDLKHQKIQSQLNLFVDNLNFIDKLTPFIKSTTGKLMASAQLKGTLDNFYIKSTLQLSKASTQIPELGLNLNPITVNAVSTNDDWQLSGSIASNGKKLNLSGKGQVQPRLKGSVQVSGRDVEVINTNEYKISASPNLNVSFSPAGLTVDGKVVIPKATLKPNDFSSSVTLPEDVTFVSDSTKTSHFPIKNAIILELGNKVFLYFMGLSGRIGGKLSITDGSHQATTAHGLLQVIDGKFQAYGQNLKLEQADILYSGGLIDNPGLKIRAVRHFTSSSSNLPTSSEGLFDFNASNLTSLDFSDNTTVGIEITGRASAPKVKLFSIPSNLSQADILSMIILGRPASQASKADGQLLIAAISSLNLGQGSNGMQLMQQMQHSLGVDISFDKQSVYNQETSEVTDTTALVLGKALSPRLYINYSIGLGGADTGIFTIKYLLNKYFNLQVSAGNDANGIDVFYTYPKS